MAEFLAHQTKWRRGITTMTIPVQYYQLYPQMMCDKTLNSSLFSKALTELQNKTYCKDKISCQ